ncbi:membrane protein [Shewanella aestuarii]|nr:membrane protein [Shewanella aestuarii]
MIQADVENPQFGGIHAAAMMALLLLFSTLIAALTVYLEVRSRGHDVTTAMVFKQSIQFVPPLLLAGVFSGLAILTPVMLFAVFGPMWLVGLVISFYLFARLAYVNFMVIVEQLTPLEAIKASFVFTGPITTKTIAILMLYIPLSLVGGTLSQIAAQVGFPLQLITDTLFAFLGLFINVALFRLYMVNRKTDTPQSDDTHTEV